MTRSLRLIRSQLVFAVWALTAAMVVFAGGSLNFAGAMDDCCCSQMAAAHQFTAAQQPPATPDDQKIQVQINNRKSCCLSGSPSPAAPPVEEKPAGDGDGCEDCSTCLACTRLASCFPVEWALIDLPDPMPGRCFDIPVAETYLSFSGGPDAPPPCL